MSLPQARLIGHAASKPTRNLLLNSGTAVKNGKFLIGQWIITHPELLEQDVKVTCTIWGELNAAKSHWSLWNSDGLHPVIGGHLPGETRPEAWGEDFVYHPEKNMWTKKATWNNFRYGGGGKITPSKACIYVYPSNISAASRIDRIKLELGWNDNPEWTSAPEDTDGTAMTLELLYGDEGLSDMVTAI